MTGTYRVLVTGFFVRGSSHFLISTWPSANESVAAPLCRLDGSSAQKCGTQGDVGPARSSSNHPSSILSSCSSMNTQVSEADGAMMSVVFLNTQTTVSPSGASEFM